MWIDMNIIKHIRIQNEYKGIIWIIMNKKNQEMHMKVQNMKSWMSGVVDRYIELLCSCISFLFKI